MSKKTIAVLAELIPVVSAVVTFLLIALPYDSDPIRKLIAVTMLLAVLGFAFFFLGRGLAKEDKAVRILGIFDWAATLSVIGFYALAVLSFGL